MNRKQFSQYIQSPEINAQLVQWIVEAFYGQEDSLCAVTLTFKPTIKYDQIHRSKDVRHFLNRLNRRVYGKSFTNGARLKCIPVFESNLSDGVHVHMFLERPTCSDRLGCSFEEAIHSEWSKLDYAGVRKAQDVRDCFCVGGWADYITKEIRDADMLSKLDIANMHIGK